MSHRVALSLAAAALLLAATLGLVARDVDRWRRDVRRGDVRFLVEPARQGLWSGPQGPSGDLARRLLGLDDDLLFREAERLFVRGQLPASTFELERARLGARGAAVARLGDVVRGDATAWRRARAETLLGLLAFQDAQGDAENGATLVRRALRSFRDASRADGAADDARYDLEVVLTLLRQRERQGREPGGDQGDAGGGVGAGITGTGAGY